ncbi:hypothetical protein GS424_000250 [Eggerthella guodeyinii]|uniref:Uncharacterized protein n=1 Tax=Eggerthella guodeyinii TaxID=2690837 RepID=A0A6L7IN59_9ACTN|nr:hypothetical protein [Eggerthella guodeyinii]QOS68346.1 hypothetical protein GS424_000250 [Eggerthella guodeyinii]
MEKYATVLNLELEPLYNDLLNLASLLLAVGDALENEGDLYAGAVVVARRELEAVCTSLKQGM